LAKKYVCVFTQERLILNTSNLGLPPEIYYQLNRSDILALVPSNCANILEVGCGYGLLGRALIARQPCSVDGVEINPEAQKYLINVYRQFWIGNVETLFFEGAQSEYDCLIFPDVLEHLIDPWKILNNLSKRLKPGGVVVASIPNVRNLALLYRLFVKGRWEYESSGLLDRTHLRFFTRREIELLFNEAGLKIELCAVNRDKYTGFKRIVSVISKMFIKDIDVCQYLIRATKPNSNG
jgi:2-polyprenyl-3-methyl-5-hydroxy-6-metoxy-1,4-benzoquinol methylase